METFAAMEISVCLGGCGTVSARAYLLLGARFVEPHRLPAGSALLVERGRIAAVDEEAVLRSLHPSAETIELGGAILLPGLIDTHTHFFEWVRRLHGIDLTGVDRIDRLREALLRQRDRVDDGRRWITGSGWDPAFGRQGLDRSLLDGLFPSIPVTLWSSDFHTVWCNSEALRRAGVIDGAQAPPGGSIGRRKDGSPDGLLHETAWQLIERAQPPESESVRRRWITEAVRRAWALGLTAVHSMEPGSTAQSYRTLARRRQLGLRVVHHTPLSELDARIAREESETARGGDGAPPDGEAGWVLDGGVKIFMDGSLGSHTAIMEDAYPEGGRGRLVLAADELLDVVLRAARRGIAPAIHAIGDAAVDTVVEVLERAAHRLSGEGRTLPVDTRIEHAQFIATSTLDRLARLPVACAMQAVHLAGDIALLRELHPRSGRRAFRLRSMLDRGIRVVLGSDAPVASIDPRRGICAAVARRADNDRNGEPWHMEEALTVAEAIEGYTRAAAAMASASRGRWGALEPGRVADLVALDPAGEMDDPFAWRDAPVRMTMVDGVVVHEDLR